MKLSDFKGLLKNSNLIFDSIENPYRDYLVVRLHSENGLEWRPGEHGIFQLPGQPVEGKNYRAFSVASIPEEGQIVLGTRTGDTPSSFKQHLANLQPGDTVAVRGPFGWFTIQDESSPMVLFASGVGITPIRALLKELEHTGNQHKVELVYASTGYYLFESELRSIADADPKINIHFTDGIEETQKILRNLAEQFSNKAYYYISGNNTVIKATRDLLKKQKISGRRIINDPFIGY